jgi:hypothetical protein
MAFKDFNKAKKEYEAWLSSRVMPNEALFKEQIEEKENKMRASRFGFLRATFFRWAETWPEICPKLAGRSQDVVLAVGDLHMENFGTWRDAEHRLVWGVNDFDEACSLPLTSDLVRTATSALLAGKDLDLSVSASDLCEPLLSGYRRACEKGGAAFVLDSGHDALRLLINAALESSDPTDFWKKLQKEKNYPFPSTDLPLPAAVEELLRDALPAGATEAEFRVVRKAKGLGSLGRPRYLALAKLTGGFVGREAKRLVPSAVDYLVDPQTTVSLSGDLSQSLGGLRSPDPEYQVHGEWVVRGVHPDAVKVELAELTPGSHPLDVIKTLLEPMGREIANIHLGSRKAPDLLRCLKENSSAVPEWLTKASEAMAVAITAEWVAFKGV